MRGSLELPNGEIRGPPYSFRGWMLYVVPSKIGFASGMSGLAADQSTIWLIPRHVLSLSDRRAPVYMIRQSNHSRLYPLDRQRTLSFTIAVDSPTSLAICCSNGGAQQDRIRAPNKTSIPAAWFRSLQLGVFRLGLFMH